VPQASGSQAEAYAIYRFWANEDVSAKQILSSHRSSVLKRIGEESVVLMIQDTTDLNFSGLKATSGLGFINQTAQQGIKVHSCLAVSESGEPLGLVGQHTWTRSERSGKKGKRRTKATEDKESQRWLDMLSAAEKGVDETVSVVHVGDREADIYDLFVQPRRQNCHLLIRAEQNRKVQEELGYLIPMAEHAPILGECRIELERNPERAARQTTVQVRGIAVTIEVPRHHKRRTQFAPVTLNVLLVEELTPPETGQPIRWLLLTTLPIDTWEQAWQCVQWYTLRWLIERFHYTLKSGCHIEHLQLETAERLIKALATYSIVAWRLMALTYQARLYPDSPCTQVFTHPEWRLLRRKFEPKNRSKRPPSLRQAIRWLAQLGGFLARKRDGEPGLKTLWRGLKVLHHLLEGAQLAAKS
jgi:hypothetical protein